MPRQGSIQFRSQIAEDVLQRNGLADLDSIFRAASAARRRHVGRSVWRTELRDGTEGTFEAFVKLSWGRRRLWPRMTDVVSGQVFQSLPAREWNGLERLEKLGLLVPERLVVCEDGILWRRSAIIVRAVPPPRSISQMVRSGDWARLPIDQKERLLEGVLVTLERIHDASLGWRGASSRHVYPARDAAGGWKLWLIDCEGIHRAHTGAVRERDVTKFVRSLRFDQADEPTFALIRSLRERQATSSLHDAGEPGRQRSAA